MGGNLGNKLFESDSEEGKTRASTSGSSISELLKMKDEALANVMLEQESPELAGLLEELRSSLDSATNWLAPAIKKITSCEVEKQAQLLSYLELKHSLTMSYSTYLTFYILLKIEQKDVSQHPVLFKMANIKKLLEQLEPLDHKLKDQIDTLGESEPPKKSKKNHKAASGRPAKSLSPQSSSGSDDHREVTKTKQKKSKSKDKIKKTKKLAIEASSENYGSELESEEQDKLGDALDPASRSRDHSSKALKTASKSSSK